jgi:hypothetical protein
VQEWALGQQSPQEEELSTPLWKKTLGLFLHFFADHAHFLCFSSNMSDEFASLRVPNFRQLWHVQLSAFLAHFADLSRHRSGALMRVAQVLF